MSGGAPGCAPLLRLVPEPRVMLGMFSAVLAEAGPGPPIAGRAVLFRVGGEVVCGALTDGSGRAECSVPVDAVQAALANGYEAAFDGDDTYNPSTATGTPLPPVAVGALRLP